MSQQPLPTYVYKLVPATSPPSSPLPPILPLSPLDAADGFIHLSTSLQLPGTISRFFTTHASIYVLKIPYGRVAGDIKWEDPQGKVSSPTPDEGLFPHLYNGGILGADHVEGVACWQRLEDASWEDTLKSEEILSFLVY